MARLIENNYGKSDVRLTKVIRNGALQSLHEMNVSIRLGGGFEVVYTQGDNSPCVPTDTMKNTVYVLARKHDFDSPESFAKILADHFVQSYPQVEWAEVNIEQTLWERIDVDGAPREHSFLGGAGVKRTCRVHATRGASDMRISGGLAGLEVIKTTGSSFSGFLKDELTTLRETDDRILATCIDAVWDFYGSRSDYNGAFDAARHVIPRVFATHQSRSVQETIFVMGQALLDAVPEIFSVAFSLPNRHRLAVNLEPFHLKNQNDIFASTSEPFGLITGTVARE